MPEASRSRDKKSTEVRQSFALKEAKTVSGSLDICVSLRRDDLVEARFFLASIIRPTFARRCYGNAIDLQ